MLWHAVVCEECGVGFEAKRASTAPRPRFCSLACYWKSGGPASNAPNVQRFRAGESTSHHRPTVFVGRVDGKAMYVQRSHFVWAKTHSDDPILPGEHIHHLDRNWRNDDPANLAKMPASAHSTLHHADVTREELSRRMAVWHREHPHAQRKGAERTCPVCGTVFYRPPSAKAKTCSYKCMGRLRTMLNIM